jgi:dephospho-CoA kinase
MLHVGLTGNIASGKSTAAMFFSELGVHVIDADRIGHELLRSGNAAHQKIVEAFGRQVLDPDGEIDRKELGRLVFADHSKRLLLNGLIHPEVGAEIRRRISALEHTEGNGLILVDAALMVETGSYKMFRCLIVAVCSPELQISRIMNRDGLTESEARERMASQMPMSEKVKLADYIIDTSGTIQQTRAQVEVVHQKLLGLETQSV